MKNCKQIIIFVLLIANTLPLLAQQREKGRIKKSNVIKPTNPYYKENESKKENYDFLEDDLPKQILDKQIIEENIPLKAPESRSVVSLFDSTNISASEKITEGNTDIVEIQEEVQLGETSEDWIKVADYFSVWDERNIDPYDIDPKEFDGPVVINLIDKANNRLSSSPTNQGALTSRFGYRWGRRHTGVDIDIETGDPIYAAFDGIVRVVGWNGSGYGKYIVLRHFNGLETLYGHLNHTDLETNTIVKAGDMIGQGGNTGRSTGSHLHFELRYEGNPFDPADAFVFPIGALKSDQLVLTPETFHVVRSGGTDEFSASHKVKYRRSVFVKVRPGDTLTGIAHRYGLSTSDLARKNRLSVNGNLMAGKKLRIQ
jgi:murein DD-endopeptidase MepM/ murein hydrolase activator NlpD